MIRTIRLTFQISAVFIGTIVGAGLASGQEICQFFTQYGYKSFWGLFVCGFVYIILNYIIIDLSIKYKLNSYDSFIKLISPGFLGEVTDIIIGLFLISSSGIILAGSGALIHQYFGISEWAGITAMAAAALIVLLRNTRGLIEINTFIVPSLIIVILTIFILYLFCYKDIINSSYIKNIPYEKSHWLFSSIIYAAFNILSCSGVMVPLSSEIRIKKALFLGTVSGAVGLTLLTLILNLILMLNVPYIYKYDIPLLYIVNRFGIALQILLLVIIWLEMFTTEVSDIYSVAKTLEGKAGLTYRQSVFLILLLAVPVSQLGFSNLIKILYPSFGFTSCIVIIQCIVFYFKDRRNI